MPTLTTFRDTIKKVTPWWLRRGIAEKLMYAIAVQFDALLDMLVFGIKARFPGAYTAESLPLIARERRIIRGRNESDEVHAVRLARWLDDHPLRGGPYGLLSQLQAHFATDPFPIQLVYASGRRFSMDIDGIVTRDDITWAPDSDTTKWARWWLFYEWPYPVTADGVWSDPGTWDEAGVWDSDLSISDAVDIRAVPKEWNAAHCFGNVVLLTGDAGLWDYPAGTWDEESGTWDETGLATLAIG